MTSARPVHRLAASSAGLLAFGALASIAWAQAPPVPGATVPPGASDWEGGIAPVTFGLLFALLALVGAVAKLADARSRREAETLALQARIADALRRDPRLANLPVVPMARVPPWRGSPPTIELSGQVPAPDLRAAALRVAQEEARRLRPDVRIQDRIAVAPTMTARIT